MGPTQLRAACESGWVIEGSPSRKPKLTNRVESWTIKAKRNKSEKRGDYSISFDQRNLREKLGFFVSSSIDRHEFPLRQAENPRRFLIYSQILFSMFSAYFSLKIDR